MKYQSVCYVESSVGPNLENVVEVARQFQNNAAINSNDQYSEPTPNVATRIPSASILLVGSVSIGGALAILVAITFVGYLCYICCCKR